MLILGNSHVSVFEDGIVCGTESVEVRWLGAVRASQLLLDGATGRSFRESVAAECGWVFLFLGNHDIQDLRRVSSERCEESFRTLLADCRRVMAQLPRGRSAWVRSVQQTSNAGGDDARRELLALEARFHRELSVLAAQAGVAILDPLAAHRAADGDVDASILQSDGLHVLHSRASLFLDEFARVSGVALAPRASRGALFDGGTEEGSAMGLVASRLPEDSGDLESATAAVLRDANHRISARGLAAKLGPDDDLGAEGLLDSLDLVEIWEAAHRRANRRTDFQVDLRAGISARDVARRVGGASIRDDIAAFVRDPSPGTALALRRRAGAPHDLLRAVIAETLGEGRRYASIALVAALLDPDRRSAFQEILGCAAPGWIFPAQEALVDAALGVLLDEMGPSSQRESRLEMVRRSREALPFWEAAVLAGRRSALARSLDAWNSHLPDDPDVARFLAWSRVDGDFNEAWSHLEMAEAIWPWSADMALMRARLLWRRGDYRAAQESMIEASRRDEANPLVGATARELIDMLENGGSTMPSPRTPDAPDSVASRIEAAVARLDDALSRNELADAARIADEIVEMAPGSVDHLRVSGQLHLRLGNKDLARNRFHRAVVADPESAAAHADLGVAWFLLERWVDARKHLEKALALDPSRLDIPPILKLMERGPTATEWMDAAKLVVPPYGATERFVRMEPLRRSALVEPAVSWVGSLSIRDFGDGAEALSGIVRHVLRAKLGLADPIRPVVPDGSVVFDVELRLAHVHGRQIPASGWASISDYDPEFAKLEGAERERDILAYRDRVLAGQDADGATFVTGAFLSAFGANTAPDELWMIDGARRCVARILAGRTSMRAKVLTTEAHHATLIPSERIDALRERVGAIKWFANYQSIPLVGLQGDRTTRRFDLIDPSLLRGASVADWGCNIGQASVRAALAGASSVVGIEGMPDTFAAAQEVGRLSGLPNLRFAQVDFNSTDFDELVDEALPGQVDWSFFFSVYRTKELVQRDRLFQKILDKSRRGVFFEGHADKVIDTVDYYRWLFESYGVQWRHLGNSEGDLRPLFLLTWDTSTQRRQAPPRVVHASPVRPVTPSPVPHPVSGATPSVAATPAGSASSTPLVTAIVSTYASSALLRSRLENLLSQTLGDRLEVVVVDSGSPENDGEIAEEFARRDPRVKVVRTAERETIYKAWNRGVEASRGRFLTNANTDDVLRSDALERLAAELESDAGTDLVYGDFWITHLPNQEFAGAVRMGYSLKPEWSPEIMLAGCHMGPQPMWRRSLHDRFGMFDASFHAAGDYEFWCRCAAGGARFRHVPEFLGLYLHNQGGLCNGDVPRVVRETAAVKDTYRGKLPAPPEDFRVEGFYRKDPLPDGAGFVNIGMVTWNRLEFTQQTIEALWRRTRYPYKLTVVDNGSTDGSVEWLREAHRQGKIANLFLLGENVGVARASNTAWAAEPQAAWYMKLDSDMVVEKGNWLEDLVGTAMAIPDIGALGYSVEPRSYPLETVGRVNVRPKRDANIGGACFLVPRAVHERLGWWCEDYGLYGEEDGDFALRIRLSGLFNAYMPDEDMFCHLPGGKAGAIDPRDLSAVDPDELRIHEDYRLWKDDLRRELQKPGGLLQRNVVAYHSGQRSVYVPRGCFQGLLGTGLQAFLRDGCLEFHPHDGTVCPEHESAVREYAKGGPDAMVSVEPEGTSGRMFLSVAERGNAKERLRASIVIPVHGHLDLTRACVESVLATTDLSKTEIVVVDDASPDGTAAWLREQEAAGRLKAVFLSPNKGFAGACNAGADAAGGEFLVFLNNDTIVRSGWLEALLAPLSDSGIGLTGARLLYPEGDIQHAGIRLHPNGLPDHEFRHAAADDPNVVASRDRAFVTGACIGLRKTLFSKVGGFDPGFKMYVEDLDLCLKVWNEGLRVRYVAECVVVHLESRTTPDLEKRTALVKTGMERLFSKWMGRWPRGLFSLPDWPANFRNETVPAAIPADAPKLHLFAPVLNFTGYARLNRESVLAAERHGLLRLSLDPSVGNPEFVRGVQAEGAVAVATWNGIISREPDHSGMCLVSDLPCNFAKLRAARPPFSRYAGLTMFETDRLPDGWKDDCLGMDEIWVPSTFNLESFARAGVPSEMLKRIPCGIDMDKFRPGSVAPLRIEGRKGVNFLSVFEWTPRKGPDALLLGWARAFGRGDDASLTLKAYVPDAKPGEIASRIDAFYRAHGFDPASVAPILVVDGFLPDAAMPSLYASADVFVLPTRGEGWGLPYLEAMASGLPVIATGWSAHLDFVTAENAYLVDHRLERVSSEQTALSQYYGPDHLWAEPSVDHLAELLRRCLTNRDEARAKGARARVEVQDSWSSRRTAEWIAEQVRNIERTVLVAGSRVPSAAGSLSAKRCRVGFDARTLSVADSVVRGIGNYAWHHLVALLEARPGCDLTILRDDAIEPPPEIVEKTRRLGAKWARWSERSATDFDVFHTPDPMHVYPGYASPFQRFGGTRITATFHDIIPIRVYEGRIANWPGYLARLDEIADRGATLLCNSEFTRRDLLDAVPLDPARVLSVGAGFNAARSGGQLGSRDIDALLRRLGIDKPFFLHVGAADPHKNFESSLAACQALSRSRPVQFVVAGKLANALKSMHDKIREAGIQDVVFTDYLSREELEALYSRAVATLFLSRYEGFGFPALEAMACGCPVVASNAASIPEVVGDAAIVHGPDDLQAIVGSMIKLLDDSRLREELSRKGLERSRLFRWSDVAERTWRAWDHLMESESRRPMPPPSPARCQWISPVWDPSGYADESRAFIRHLASTDIPAGVLALGRHSETFRQAAVPADRKLFDSLMGRELVPGCPVVLDLPGSGLGRIAGAGHHVGRTTFETDSLPADWIPRCNSMDEIWVPCRFNRETFAKAGVARPILVVPEGVDTARFRPGIEPLRIPGVERGTTFLAVFEWTRRKGADVLLAAWAKAFAAGDDVRLVLRTYPPNAIEGDPGAWVDAKIEEELARVGRRRSECAPIVVLSAQVPDADMPRLYAAADVYVAPSRGEGWGRPHMEAMSSGVPVISTRWSGNLEFQDEDNSWLIALDGMETIDDREEFPGYKGHRWASPSVGDLAMLMAVAASDPAARRRKGERARIDMVSRWDWSRIAPLAEIRLKEILEGVPAERSVLAPGYESALGRVRVKDGGLPAIRWVGPAFNFSGYARLAREALAALDARGVACSVDPLANDPEWFRGLSADRDGIARWRRMLSDSGAEADVLVVCEVPRTADGSVDLLRQVRDSYPGKRVKVAWSMFETDSLPAGWAESLNQMDQVWVPSRHNLSTFARAGVDASRLRLVPCGIDVAPFDAARGRPLGIPGQKPATTFLSVFQWSLRKGWDVLLDAWSQAFGPGDDVRLVLRCHGMGDGPTIDERLDAWCVSRGLDRSSLAAIVVADEFIPDPDMPRLYEAADVFVLPSRGEGWGIPYLEAMAAGKPVIGTCWGGSADFLHEGIGWMLPPGDPIPVPHEAMLENPFLDGEHQWSDPKTADLVVAMRAAHASPEERRIRGERGCDEVRRIWNPETTVRAMRAAFGSERATAPGGSRLSGVLGAIAIGLRKRGRGIEPSEPVSPSNASSSSAAATHLSVRWEGSQLVHHSLAHVNRELCVGLAKRGHDLSVIPFEPDQFAAGDDPDLRIVEQLTNAPLEGSCQVHVRHQWPPNLSAPEEGRWVIVQPWEFGSPPKDWMPAFRDQVDELWAYTRHVRDMYVRAGVPEDRVHIVPLGVDCDKFRPGLAPLASLPAKKGVRFLYVGGSIARKGFDVLLNAWQKAFAPDDQVELLIKDMGGKTTYAGQTGERFVRQIQESGRFAPIHYVCDDLPPSDLPALYASGDVLVHPYRGEGFGLPIAEAMACGLPVVITAGGAADDFCSAEEGWMVRSERVLLPGGKVDQLETVDPPWWLEPSEDALVAALREAATDAGMRSRKGAAARARIAGSFTWAHAVEVAEARLRAVADTPVRRMGNASAGADLPSPSKPVDAEELAADVFQIESAVARGEFVEADRLADEMVARHPRSPAAWLARAMVYRGQKKVGRALDALNKALECGGGPEVRYETLALHLQAGKDGAARTQWNLLRETYPSWVERQKQLHREQGLPWLPDRLQTAGKSKPRSKAKR